MPNVVSSYNPIWQFNDANGNPLVGGQLFTYVAGSSTKQATWTDSTGTVQNTNPIILNSRGETANVSGTSVGIWTPPGVAYRYVLSPATDTDPPSAPIDVIDNVVGPLTTLTAAAIGAVLYPQTPAEAAAGVTPTHYEDSPWVYDVRRVGVVPNDATAASANTAALRALWNPANTGPVGQFVFPNTTGADTYFINGQIPIRDGVKIDLGGCTISATATGIPGTDDNAGFFFAIRDFELKNGAINVTWATSTSNGGGNAIQVGGRKTDSPLWPTALWDSLLPAPMGNILLRDLQITMSVSGTNVAATGGIAVIGGLRNVVMDNIYIHGSANLQQGIVYEFGFATNEAQADQRQTSHIRDWSLRNIEITNLDTTNGVGLQIAGAYNVELDNVTVAQAKNAINLTPGESLFYRPWTGKDVVGAKRTKTLRNIVAQAITGNAISLAGSQLASGGYLATLVAGLGHPADYIAQTDLSDYVLDGFAIDGNGTLTGNGIQCSAGTAAISNGTITGFVRGISGTDEWTNVAIDTVRITGCGEEGINLNGGGAVWSPTRLKTGHIRNCFIAGNSTASANTSSGILVANTAALTIEDCRLNYESAHDGADETTQASGIRLSTSSLGVLCRNNYVGHVIAGSYGYLALTSAPVMNGNNISMPKGTTTSSGPWNYDDVGSASGTQLADKTTNPNTYGKYFGRKCWNTSTSKLYWAAGSANNDLWIPVDNSGNITPV